jgi:hypothetical protein
VIRLVRLALGHALRRRATSTAAVVLPLVMAAAVITLTGEQTHRASQLLQTLRDTKSRSLVLRAVNADNRIPPMLARTLASLPGVELAVGFPPARSVTTRGLHDPLASAGLVELDTLTGSLPLHLGSGRMPEKGEVVISAGAAQALRMNQPLATGVSTDGATLPIVGTYTMDDTGAISTMLANAVLAPANTTDEYATVVFLAREPADIATIVAVVNSAIGKRDGVSLEYEPRAAQLQQTVATAGSKNVASIALSVVLIGALIQTASSLLNSILQRRENARRRALGFTRSEIVTLGVLEAALLSALGSTLGALGAAIRLAGQTIQIQSGQIAATIGLLTVLAVLAAIPGGATAAAQDPARILRVP